MPHNPGDFDRFGKVYLMVVVPFLRFDRLLSESSKGLLSSAFAKETNV